MKHGLRPLVRQGPRRGARTLAARLALLPHVLASVETVAYAHSQRIIHWVTSGLYNVLRRRLR